MNLGAFSVSLVVKDMAASLEFYKTLGFETVGGDGDTWAILANEGQTVIGLFHGMFENNILTFNPGWHGVGEDLDEFTDVRDLATQLRASGIEVSDDNTAEAASGPACFSVTDPDGNVILVDQHR